MFGNGSGKLRLQLQSAFTLIVNFCNEMSLFQFTLQCIVGEHSFQTVYNKFDNLLSRKTVTIRVEMPTGTLNVISVNY